MLTTRGFNGPFELLKHTIGLFKPIFRSLFLKKKYIYIYSETFPLKTHLTKPSLTLLLSLAKEKERMALIVREKIPLIRKFEQSHGRIHN